VDTLLLIHFDKQFSQQTGEEFIRGLARDLGVLQSICVGANFVFGYRRGGNVELLKKLGEELKFTVHGLAAIELDGKAVSSTRIREAIQAGELNAAGQMLDALIPFLARSCGEMAWASNSASPRRT